MNSTSPQAAPNDCALCTKPIGPGGAVLANGKKVCAPCKAKLERQLLAQTATRSSLLRGAVGGIGGSLVGAAIWTAVAESAQLEVGYVAVLVGFLVGKGMLLAVGRARGPALQRIAALCALLGLLIAKYAIFAIEVTKVLIKEGGPEIGYLSPRMIEIFGQSASKLFSPYDLLWIFLAVSVAYKMPRKVSLKLTPIDG